MATNQPFTPSHPTRPLNKKRTFSEADEPSDKSEDSYMQKTNGKTAVAGSDEKEAIPPSVVECEPSSDNLRPLPYNSRNSKFKHKQHKPKARAHFFSGAIGWYPVAELMEHKMSAQIIETDIADFAIRKSLVICCKSGETSTEAYVITTLNENGSLNDLAGPLNDFTNYTSRYVSIVKEGCEPQHDFKMKTWAVKALEGGSNIDTDPSAYVLLHNKIFVHHNHAFEPVGQLTAEAIKEMNFAGFEYSLLSDLDHNSSFIETASKSLQDAKEKLKSKRKRRRITYKDHDRPNRKDGSNFGEGLPYKDPGTSRSIYSDLRTHTILNASTNMKSVYMGYYANTC